MISCGNDGCTCFNNKNHQDHRQDETGAISSHSENTIIESVNATDDIFFCMKHFNSISPYHEMVENKAWEFVYFIAGLLPLFHYW